MKTRIAALMIICLFVSTLSFAQEKSKKQIKEEKKEALKKEVENLVNSKQFVFIAETAFPAGYRSVTLSGNSYSVEFYPDNIISNLPYFGRTYNAGGAFGDTGLKFEGAPTEYSLETTKKKHEIRTVVKGATDNYQITLLVSFDSSASLSIVSNNRNSISYNGQIYPFPGQKEVK